MRQLIRLLMCAGILVGLSCSEELNPTPYTYTRLFTGENNKTWEVTLFEETLDGKVVDRFLPSCLADDQFIFYANTDHLFETTSGSKKCFSGEPAKTQDTWTFSNATATLTMVLPILSDNALPYIVREVNKKDLRVEIFFDETNTASYRIQFKAIDEE